MNSDVFKYVYSQASGETIYEHALRLLQEIEKMCGAEREIVQNLCLIFGVLCYLPILAEGMRRYEEGRIFN